MLSTKDVFIVLNDRNVENVRSRYDMRKTGTTILFNHVQAILSETNSLVGALLISRIRKSSVQGRTRVKLFYGSRKPRLFGVSPKFTSSWPLVYWILQAYRKQYESTIGNQASQVNKND